MIPRKELDIGWGDLAYAGAACLAGRDRRSAQQRLEALWSPLGYALASLSIRSGFDALLRTLAYPRGSEILVSAITVRDMVAIIEHHGLRAVPLDVDVESLSIAPGSLGAALTAETRAILVAHLFGSRMDMEPIAAFARAHGLHVFEDCAQAYAADGYRGHPESDVAMFSFGPIKTATALGGALLTFCGSELCARARLVQQGHPVQSRGAFLRRVAKYAVLKLLSYRIAYSLFGVLCRLRGTTHDAVIVRALRGFAGGDFFAKIRRQPSAPLLALLERRIRGYAPARLLRRVEAAATALALMPRTWRVGALARHHTHWVFPILSSRPELLIRHLWRHGFDGTRGGSSLYVLPSASVPGALDSIVYLPVHAGHSTASLRLLMETVTRFEAPLAGPGR